MKRRSQVTTAFIDAFPDESTIRSKIPLNLNLDNVVLSMNNNGKWDLQNSNQQETTERIRVLETETMQLRKENEILQKKYVEISEEANMHKFKCQLLLEMLAISSLDEEKSKAEAEQERAKAQSMHNDLVLLLDQAKKDGLSVHKLSLALSKLHEEPQTL